MNEGETMRQDQQNTKPTKETPTKNKGYNITTKFGVSLNDEMGIFKSPKSLDFWKVIFAKYLFIKSKPIIYGNNGNKMGIRGAKNKINYVIKLLLQYQSRYATIRVRKQEWRTEK